MAWQALFQWLVAVKCGSVLQVSQKQLKKKSMENCHDRTHTF